MQINYETDFLKYFREDLGQSDSIYTQLTDLNDRRNSFRNYRKIATDFFNNTITVNDLLNEILRRWGTCFFASILTNPSIPDYFIYNANHRFTEALNVQNMWNGLIKDILNKYHSAHFSNIDLFEPHLSLVVIRSSKFKNARLAKYFLSQELQHNMFNSVKDYHELNNLQEGPILREDHLITSRFYELLATTESHLFGRSNFLTEFSVDGEGFQNFRIILSEKNEKFNSVPIHYEESQRTCYINTKLVSLLGSQNFDDKNDSLIEIQRQIIKSCAISMQKLIENNISEENAQEKITQIAPDIARAIKNYSFRDSDSFEKIINTCVDHALSIIFSISDTYAQQMIHLLNTLLPRNGIRTNLQNQLESKFPLQNARSILFGNYDRIKTIVYSLLDVIIFAPWCKSILLNHYKFNHDLSVIWVVLGASTGRSNVSMNKARDVLQAYSSKIWGSFPDRAEPPIIEHDKSPNLIECLQKIKNRIIYLTDALIRQPERQHAIEREKDKLNEIIEFFKYRDGKAHVTINEYCLCLILEVCSYLTDRVHEGHPLEFTFLISSSKAWRAFSNIISDNERFFPAKDIKWDAKTVSKMIDTNYSIYQVDRVVAFFDRKQVWDSGVIKKGQIAKISESSSNKGLMGYPFFYHSSWDTVDDWGENDYIVYVHRSKIIVLRGYVRNGKKLIKPHLVWDMKKNEIINIRDFDADLRTYLELFFDDTYHTDIMLEVLTTISTSFGEGALIIFNKSNDNNQLESSFAIMDPVAWTQLWRLDKDLIKHDKDTLRALLRMDGATRVIKTQSSEPTVSSRCSIRPLPAYAVLGERLEDLIGKGTRHHSAAALSQMFLDEWNNNIRDKGAVISVSADGPITIWPLQQWCRNQGTH